MTDAPFDPTSFIRTPTYGPKFGRLPRRFDERVPKLSATQTPAIPAPPSIDYTAGMSSNLREFLNDELQCCTCSAILHAQQVWSFNANPPMASLSDADALAVYKAACGYNGTPASDTGGDEQTVLTYWLKNAVAGNTLAAFVEIDVKNTAQVKQAIFDSGLVYIGFEVPDWLDAPSMKAPGATWIAPAGADSSSIGGHAVIAAGYDAVKLTIISWGALYYMPWETWDQFVDECYCLVDQEWVKQTGQTPGGLSMAALEQQMQALQQAHPWWKF